MVLQRDSCHFPVRSVVIQPASLVAWGFSSLPSVGKERWGGGGGRGAVREREANILIFPPQREILFEYDNHQLSHGSPPSVRIE